MAKVVIYSDEWYPIYVIDKDWEWDDGVYEIPDELLAEWEDVKERFDIIQNKIVEIIRSSKDV